MSHDVFISYSTIDKAVADAVVSRLETAGIRCWYAPRDIPPGEEWASAISEAITASQVMLLIFSENANRSQRVLDELNLAIEEEIRILPFRIENLNPSGAMRLHLSSRHWLDAFSPSWKSHLDQLEDSVRAMVPGDPAVRKPSAGDGSPGPAAETARKSRVGSGVPWLAAAGVIAVLAAVGGGLAVWKPWAAAPAPTETSRVAAPAPTSTVLPTEILEPTLTAEPSLTPPPLPTAVKDSRRIVYLGNNQGVDILADPSLDLYIQNADGSNPAQLTDDGAFKETAAFSPDGTRILFDSEIKGDSDLFVIDADGENLRQLTSNNEIDRHPAYSPDGSEIVFVRNNQLLVIDEYGAREELIFQSYGNIGYPSYSPDGEKIVFQDDLDGDDEIYRINRDGTGLVQLTDNEWDDREPHYHPDGSRIIFYSELVDVTEHEIYEIVVMNADGSNPSKIARNLLARPSPAFSPDGEQIVFIKMLDGSGHWQVYLMDADGSDPRDIFPYFHDATNPSFSPAD